MQNNEKINFLFTYKKSKLIKINYELNIFKFRKFSIKPKIFHRINKEKTLPGSC